MTDFLAIICAIIGAVSIGLIAFCCLILLFADALLDLIVWLGWCLILAVYLTFVNFIKLMSNSK